jgi:hypothetical protein
MEWKAVHGSSSVVKYKYESGDLFVQYNNGATYIYNGVPEHLVTAFERTVSKGKFLASYVQGKFNANRI